MLADVCTYAHNMWPALSEKKDNFELAIFNDNHIYFFFFLKSFFHPSFLPIF